MPEASHLLDLGGGLALEIGTGHPSTNHYPTRRLQRGFHLLDEGQDLAEEAVGFGVPVVRRGLQTLFPSGVVLDWPPDAATQPIAARFKLDLVEKLSGRKDQAVESPLLYGAKTYLAEAIRRWPATRSALTATSSLLRRIFGWETTYTDAGIQTQVDMTYQVDRRAGKVRVDIDTTNLTPGITEVVVMNEQGAHHFDHYRDASGLALEGRRIGCWDEVRGDTAWFESSRRGVVFKLEQAPPARLFRGRELVGARLAWAGFGYTFQPSVKRLRYELTIARLA